MKSIRMTIRIAAMMVIVAMGCKEDDSVPNQEIEDLLRAHVWLEDYTKIDGVFSELYEGMTLAFGSTTYTTTNGKSLWKSSVTWEFKDKNHRMIIRDDGLEIDIVMKAILKFVTIKDRINRLNLGKYEKDKIHGEPDHWHTQGAGTRKESDGFVPRAWDQSTYILPMEEQVFRIRCEPTETHQGPGARVGSVQEDRC